MVEIKEAKFWNMDPDEGEVRYMRMLVPHPTGEVIATWFEPFWSEKPPIKFGFNWVGVEKNDELEAMFQGAQ